MSDLADVNMQGVVPTGDSKELEVGTYLVRIEDAGKKAAKDKFDANGVPEPGNGKNFYVAVDTKVWDGPDLGHEEAIILNLWNVNETAVRIGKAELLAIQNAVGVHTPRSYDLVGKWMLREVYLNRNGKKADKWLPIPAAHMSMIPQNVPPVPATKYAAQAPAQTHHHAQPAQSAQPAYMAHTGAQGHVATGMAPIAAADNSPSGTPSWLGKK